MIAVIQRVKSCSITINNTIHSNIESGVLVFIGIENGDINEDINFIANKIINMRIFNDNYQKMNYSVADISGDIMVVSQFTLCADATKGLRPSFIKAMPIKHALNTYNKFLDCMNRKHNNIQSGVFQADMLINSVNDGPVTLIVRSNTIASN